MKILFLGGTSYLGKEIIKRLQSNTELELSAYVRNDKLNDLYVKTYTSADQIPEQDVVMNLVVDYGKGKELAEVMAVNVDFPFSILEKLNFKTVINFSTGLDKSVSHYAFSKRTLEEKLDILGKEKHKQIINLRLQHFYGPGAPAHNFITFLISSMKAGNELPLTDCQQRRDFVFTDDVLDGVEVILKKLKDIPSNEVLEIGYGQSMKLQDVVEMIKQKTASQSNLKYGAFERRQNEPSDLFANIDKMQKLGWSPKTSIESGISKSIK